MEGEFYIISIWLEQVTSSLIVTKSLEALLELQFHWFKMQATYTQHGRGLKVITSKTLSFSHIVDFVI